MFVSLDEINVPVKDLTVGSDMTEETVKISPLFAGLKILSPTSNKSALSAVFAATVSTLTAFAPRTLNDVTLDDLSERALAFDANLLKSLSLLTQI